MDRLRSFPYENSGRHQACRGYSGTGGGVERAGSSLAVVALNIYLALHSELHDMSPPAFPLPVHHRQAIPGVKGHVFVAGPQAQR